MTSLIGEQKFKSSLLRLNERTQRVVAIADEPQTLVRYIIGEISLIISIKNISRYLHRYLGLVSGIIVGILCATGVLLLLQPEIERIAEPDRFVVSGRGSEPPLPLDELIARIEENERERFSEKETVSVTRVNIPKSPRRTRRVLISVSADKRNRPQNYSVYADPYSGQIVARGPSKTQDFFRSVRRLHVSLGLPREKGRPIIGYSTLIFTIVLVTGFIRWLPTKLSKSAWKASLVPTVTKGYFRAVYSLHNVLGFYAALPLLILGLTGIWLAFPNVRDSFDRVIRYERSAASKVEFLPTGTTDRSMTLEDVFNRHLAISGARSYDLYIPTNPSTEPLRISQSDGFYYPKTYYWNQFTGELIATRQFGDLTRAQQIRFSILPLHKGVFWGDVTRLLFLASCIVGVALVVTGYLFTLKRWDNEDRKKQRLKLEREDAKRAHETSSGN